MGMCGVCVGMHGCVWVCTGVCGCARVCAGVRMCARVCTGVHKCVQVYIHVRGWVMVCVGVHTRTWVGVGVHVCVWKFAEVRGCLRVCVLDEFSEYLLETGVNTSADFNTYPIRIFFQAPSQKGTIYYIIYCGEIYSINSKYFFAFPMNRLKEIQFQN